MGSIARLWWSPSRSLGNVCYLHWADVHPRLHRETPQICYLVSLLAFPTTSQMSPLHSLPVFGGDEITARQMYSGTYLIRPAVRLCELMQPSGVCYACFHSPSFDRQLRRMETMCHLTSLASGRSTLDPPQRSCGRKVRREAGYREPCPQSTTLCLALRASSRYDMKDTSANACGLAADGRWEVFSFWEPGAS